MLMLMRGMYRLRPPIPLPAPLPLPLLPLLYHAQLPLYMYLMHSHTPLSYTYIDSCNNNRDLNARSSHRNRNSSSSSSSGRGVESGPVIMEVNMGCSRPFRDHSLHLLWAHLRHLRLHPLRRVLHRIFRPRMHLCLLLLMYAVRDLHPLVSVLVPLRPLAHPAPVYGALARRTLAQTPQLVETKN